MATTADSPRTLVLCFDGTAGEFTRKNTNVVKFFGLLSKDDQNRQVCYYQAGVGTYTNPSFMSPVSKWFAKVADEAFAWYLDHHVMGGYQFLMDNYRNGDKICLFGFSRGAYTARALAGMLYRVGLIPRGNLEEIGFAYKVYASTGKKSNMQAELFKKTFSRSVCVEFVGCWDTVSSTGVLYSRQLPFTASTSSIKTFRHALALDEHRSRFQPNVWHRTAPSRKATMLDPQHGSAVQGQESPVPNHPSLPEETTQPAERNPTDVLEVWFAGGHSDIGGGNYNNPDQVTLADITLRWMVREVVKSQVGLVFNPQAMREAGFTEEDFLVTTLLSAHSKATERARGDEEKAANGDTSTVPDSTTDEPSDASDKDGDAENKDMRDMNSSINDALKQTPAWWFVEILPFPFSWQDMKGVWHRKWSVNFGRGRTIYDPKPNLYVTVKERMEDKSVSYTPRAKYDKTNVVWREV